MGNLVQESVFGWFSGSKGGLRACIWFLRVLPQTGPGHNKKKNKKGYPENKLKIQTEIQKTKTIQTTIWKSCEKTKNLNGNPEKKCNPEQIKQKQAAIRKKEKGNKRKSGKSTNSGNRNNSKQKP